MRQQCNDCLNHVQQVSSNLCCERTAHLSIMTELTLLLCSVVFCFFLDRNHKQMRRGRNHACSEKSSSVKLQKYCHIPKTLNSSVSSVLGSLSCVMQHRWFNPSLCWLLLWVTMGSLKNSYGWEYKPRSSLCCILLHGLKRSWRSCPKWVNANKKNTSNMHNPRRQNVATSVAGFKNSHIRKNLNQMVNPRDIAWNEEEEDDTKSLKLQVPAKTITCSPALVAGWEVSTDNRIYSSLTIFLIVMDIATFLSCILIHMSIVEVDLCSDVHLVIFHTFQTCLYSVHICSHVVVEILLSDGKLFCCFFEGLTTVWERKITFLSFCCCSVRFFWDSTASS